MNAWERPSSSYAALLRKTNDAEGDRCQYSQKTLQSEYAYGSHKTEHHGVDLGGFVGYWVSQFFLVSSWLPTVLREPFGKAASRRSEGSVKWVYDTNQVYKSVQVQH